MTHHNKPSLLLWSVPLVVVLAVIAAFVVNSAEQSRKRLPELGEVPSFRLTASNGEELTRMDLNGRLHIVNFMFTRCQGVCPTMSANIKKMYELYRGSDKVRFLSITVDPDYDTLAVLRSYAEQFDVNDNRWMFARAPLVDVAALLEHGFMLDASDLPSNHPSYLILVDSEGQIRGYYSYNDDEELTALRENIRNLARSM